MNYKYSAFDRYNEEVLKSDQRANQSASTEIIGGISRQTSKQPGTYYAICTLDGQFSIIFLKNWCANWMHITIIIQVLNTQE